MKKITERAEWQALKNYYKKIAHIKMQTWFKKNPNRFEQFSIKAGSIFLDYSKNRITPEALALFIKLSDACGLPDKIQDLFTGKMVNPTEKRAALHTALRESIATPLFIDGHNIKQDIATTLNRMQAFVEQVHQNALLGVTGKPLRYFINIGIGGSHLGPLMTIHALREYAAPKFECYFISNIDSAHLKEVLGRIDPAASLFIISSKSFETLETITNANTIKHWLQRTLQSEDVTPHFVAVTSQVSAALAFGIQADYIFPLWDWVGGRYSIWSAIGLPLALMIGMKNFQDFLAGAHEMDQHFRFAPFLENIPVIMGFLGIWYVNFFQAPHLALVPYSHALNYLRIYLQQLDMESNGKHISVSGELLNIATSPVIFGEQGCNGQHSYHQMLHQGRHFIPVDFILVGDASADWPMHHNILVGSGLSQAQALLQGRSFTEAYRELKKQGCVDELCAYLARHKTIPGNRPSNTLFLDKIGPKELGSLLALYEHKTFVQGAIWNINSFDQWGVELGKQLLPTILAHLATEDLPHKVSYDPSTRGLIEYFKNLRGGS